MERFVRVRLTVALWCLAISIGYLVLYELAPSVAEGLLVAFVALLVVPAGAVEAWWEAKR